MLTTTVTEAGAITNGMTVSFDDYLDGGDALPGNNTTTSGVTSADGLNWADIRVAKTLNPVPSRIFAGEPITFDIEIVNAGPATATNVVLDDRLNDIVAASGGGEPGPGDVGIRVVPGLATGMITGLLATSRHADATRECPEGACAPNSSGWEAAQSFRTLRTVSSVGYVVGVVGLAGGITLLLTAPKARPARAMALEVGAGALRLEGSF